MNVMSSSYEQLDFKNGVGMAVEQGGHWLRHAHPPYSFCIMRKLNLGGHSKFQVGICPPKTPLVAPMVIIPLRNGIFLELK